MSQTRVKDVPYKEVRDKIRTADLISFAGTNVLSYVARWYTRSEFSHVGLAAWIETVANHKPRLCMVDASLGGIRMVPLSWMVNECHKSGSKVYWQPFIGMDEKRGKLTDFILDRWGKPYPRGMQFVALAFDGWRQWLGKKTDICPDRFHCSELITAALKHLGMTDRVPVKTMPVDVVNMEGHFGERVNLVA